MRRRDLFWVLQSVTTAAMLSMVFVSNAQARNVAGERRHQRDAARRDDGLVVHEWGTISILQGSDNALIDGLAEDQSDLPDFVSVWSKMPIQMPRVIEKPLVYFYSRQALNVVVTVGCPTGILSQWWPAVEDVQPHPPFADQPKPPARNGRLRWNVRLLPDFQGGYRDVPKASWWPLARETDATPVSALDQTEKFLFYRGMTEFEPSVRVRIGPGDTVSLTNIGDEPVQHLFVVNVVNERALHDYVATLAPGETIERKTAVDASRSPKAVALSPKTRAQFQELLEEEGLFEKEARGMTTIWEKGYFQHDGLRVIYLMPNRAVERLLPLSIEPAPAHTTRILTVKIECFTADREKAIRALIDQLGASSYADRELAEKKLRRMDRYAEAYLRKILNTTPDPEIKYRIENLLKSIKPLSPLD